MSNYRIYEEHSVFYPQSKRWFFGWKTIHDVSTQGMATITSAGIPGIGAFSLEDAQELIKRHVDKTTVIVHRPHR